ncbi:MAG: FHA domain-containing protein, partial [Pseudomonadota bacterium]
MRDVVESCWMVSEHSNRPTREDLPCIDDSSRRCLLVFEPAGTRAIDLPASGRLVIGRAEDANIVLADESVSRRHAELVILGSAAMVTDLGSRNGTWVGGKRIHAPQHVKPSDAIRIGATSLMIGAAPVAEHGWLLSPTEFEARVAASLDEARRSGTLVVLFHVRMPATKSDDISAAVRGALELPASPAGTGIGCRYNANDYKAAIALAAIGSALLDRLVANLRAAVAATSPDARVSWAAFPRDATRLDELISASAAALREPAPAS